MVDGNSSLSASIVDLVLISCSLLKFGVPELGEIRRAAMSVDFHPLVAEIVLCLGDEDLGLSFRCHLRANGGFDALYQFYLFRFFEPAFYPCGVALPLIPLPHLSEQKLPFELLTRQFL